MLVAHVVGPVDLVEAVARLPDAVEKLNIQVQIGVVNFLAPFRFLQHGDEEPLRAHGPAVSHVKAEPESADDPVALRLPAIIIGLQISPGNAAFVEGHAALGVQPFFRVLDFEIQKFGGGAVLFPAFLGRPPGSGIDAVFVRLFQHLFLIPGRIVHRNGGHLVQVKIGNVIPGGHALGAPAVDGFRPGTVENGNPVRFPVFVHAGKPLVGRHHNQSTPVFS